jgi:hypothetical protein
MLNYLKSKQIQIIEHKFSVFDKSHKKWVIDMWMGGENFSHAISKSLVSFLNRNMFDQVERFMQ